MVFPSVLLIIMALAKTLVHQQVAKIPKTENSHMSATNS